MGINTADITAYLNSAIELGAAPATQSIIHGTIAQLGMNVPVGVELRTTPGLRRIGFAQDSVNAALTFSVADASFLPGLNAKKQQITFTGTVSDGDTIKVRNTTYEFSTNGAFTVGAGHITIPATSLAPSVCSAYMASVYAANPEAPTISRPTLSSIQLENERESFDLYVKSAVASQLAALSLSDGSAMLNVITPPGKTITAADTVTVTYGGYTRADGRTVGSATTVITAT